MSKLETTIIMLDYMENKILPVLEKAIQIIPKENLDYKPNNKLNTIKWLAYHSLNGPFVYLKGVEYSTLSQELFDSFKLDLKDIDDSSLLLEYANKLRSYIKELRNKLTEEDLNKTVEFQIWEKWKQSGFEAVQTSVEEMIHHRGQLCTYLRLLDLNPPLLYSYL